MAFTGPGSNQPPSGDPVFWRVSGSNVYYSGGNVGIGTTAPGEKLEVTGNIKLSGTTPTYKITNAANPTAAQDVATKAYVDARVEYIVYDRWAGAVPYGCPTLPAAYCPDGWSVVQSWAGDCMRTWNDGWADWYIQARQTLCSKN